VEVVKLDSNTNSSAGELPSRAQAVIIGGGVAGCSVAYHLATLGWGDIVLLERGQLTCGTTWHAAGLVLAHVIPEETLTGFARYSQALYASLEEETGQATGYKQVGHICIACTPHRLEEFRRLFATVRAFGVEVEEISASEVQRYWPLLYTDDILAGFYSPTEAVTNPIDTTMALAKGAKMRGAQVFEETRVVGITRENGRVMGVMTNRGGIQSEYVVNCAGMWARELGKMAGVDVPLHAAEHYYLVTEPLEGLDSDLPIVDDYDCCAYYREETGKLLMGLFEPSAAPWGMAGIPQGFSFGQLPPDWDRMMPYVERALGRVPSAMDIGVQMLFNGPESFTPDGLFLMGESPELKGFYVLAGFNSAGILLAPGAGRALAEWMVNGRPAVDLWHVNLDRMMPFQNSAKYLHDRTVEVLGLIYVDHWPSRQLETARGIRKSALHDRLEKAGACFAQSSGWEVADWFAPEGVAPVREYSWGRGNWFNYVAEEHRTAREDVVLFDQSCYSKFLVQGRDAERTLNHISANNVAVPVGKCVYMQWLNENGGIEEDLTATRLSGDCFLIIAADYTQNHVLSWLKAHIPPELHAVATDVTSGYAMVSVQGPRSRDLLGALTDADLSNQAFPMRTLQEIDLAYARVMALRMTFFGELGWELIIPTEFAASVYDALVESGKMFGLKHVGLQAMNTLRIEKGYRVYGFDIADADTPLEAGLGFAVDFEKPGGFIGREALLRLKESGPLSRRMAQFRLEDPEPLLYFGEPIYRDGILVGSITTGGYGHTLGASVGLGYLSNQDGVTKDFLTGGQFEIEVAGSRYSAVASFKPMYDPANAKILG
jgi:glycine cleavage system aminomethyltransferase T/glycine/D-amino acid oxidase-like deaminating enzyme